MEIWLIASGTPVVEQQQAPSGAKYWLFQLFIFVLPTIGLLSAVASVIINRGIAPLNIALFFGFWWITGFGITVGYHRLATHRSFDTSPALRLILYIMGSMAVQGAVIEWTANHLKHHTYSDREGDPHSPTRGLVFSHWGWLRQSVEIETERYAAPLMRDPIAVFASRSFPIWVTLGYVIPFIIGGWEGLIWGGLFRQFVVQNVTFGVNSLSHRWGSRPFDTGDRSTNNWLIGILGLGEGWHNNHHAFPASAFHGMRWWEIDVSAYLIRTLRLLRLARNVHQPALTQIQRKLLNPAALSQYLWITD